MKNTRILRYLSYWIYVILTIGIPIALIAWQFELFKKPGVLQITGYGIIAIIVAVFLLKDLIKKTIADMEKGVLRTILQNVLHLAPYVAFWILLTFLEDHIAKVRFILLWSVISNFIAMFIDIWHTTLVQKCEKE